MLAQEESPKPFRLSVEVGSQHSPARTTSGRLLLAYLAEDDLAAILAAQPEWSRTPAAEKTAFKQRLADVRERGFDRSQNERFVGGLDIGVLVGSPKSSIKAALTIATLEERGGGGPDLDAMLPKLQACAATIGAQAGLTEPEPLPK